MTQSPCEPRNLATMSLHLPRGNVAAGAYRTTTKSQISVVLVSVVAVAAYFRKSCESFVRGRPTTLAFSSIRGFISLRATAPRGNVAAGAYRTTTKSQISVVLVSVAAVAAYFRKSCESFVRGRPTTLAFSSIRGS